MTEPIYQITREAGAVRLSGDLDINSRDELRDTLAAAVEEAATREEPATRGEEAATRGETGSEAAPDAEAGEGRGKVVVVDFDHTAFLDSEAMGALIDGFLTARAAGVRMSIVNAHGLVHRVLEVSGVLEMFETGQG